MPKIRKIDVRTTDKGLVSLDHGTIQFTTHVHYVNKLSEFHIPLPHLFSQFVDAFRADDKYGYRNRHPSPGFFADTEAKVVDNFMMACRLFFAAEKREEKVILYRYEYNSEKHDSMKGTSRHRFHSSNDNGSEIRFDFEIATKVMVGPSVKYLDSNGHTLVRGHDCIQETAGAMGIWVEIPYTEQSEQFFTSIRNGLDSIMEKMSMFLKTKNDVLSTIESRKLLV